MNNSSRYRIIGILLLAQYSAFSLAEEEEEAEEATQVEDDDIDGYVIVAFCVLFAACLSLIGVVIGFISFMEDYLMRCYQREGQELQAHVVSSEFVRVMSKSDSSHSDASGCEYAAFITYKMLDEEKNTQVIRKQVKCTSGDFAPSPVPPSIKFKILTFDDIESKPSDDTPTSTKSPQLIDILVLPGYLKSGLPRRYIERVCSLKYRLPTVVLVLFMIAFSALCIYVAIVSLPGWEDRDMSLFSALCVYLAVLLFIEVLFVYLCLGNVLRQAMRVQYLEGGDSVSIHGDDTTISSGEDSFLV